MSEDFFSRSFRRIVVKLGTGILTDEEGGINRDRISAICREVDATRKSGVDVCIVSSGAVGLGMKKLGFAKRPTDLSTLQSCAAVGQSILTQTWQESMDPFGHTVAQILLTREDLRGRRRHVTAMETMERLLAMNVVPVVNENDCVSSQEIRFGDNDVLSALVASLIKADLLFILSTAPGLLNRETGDLVKEVKTITADIEAMAGGTESPTAVGGMVTKIHAARIATRSGCGVIIGSGTDPRLLSRIENGSVAGTLFLPTGETMSSRKRWLAFFDQPSGWIVLDEGAADAVREKGRSLLATGVVECGGSFQSGDLVDVRDLEGKAFARGVIAYGSAELKEVAGKKSDEVLAMDPERRQLEVIHRSEMVLLEELSI
ncbi:MAG: glutamate 5-kinase [Verrucomicrobiota bacterium]